MCKLYSLPCKEQADREMVAVSASIEGASIATPRYEHPTSAEAAGIEGADDCGGTPCDIVKMSTALSL